MKLNLQSPRTTNMPNDLWYLSSADRLSPWISTELELTAWKSSRPAAKVLSSARFVAQQLGQCRNEQVPEDFIFAVLSLGGVAGVVTAFIAVI